MTINNQNIIGDQLSGQFFQGPTSTDYGAVQTL